MPASRLRPSPSPANSDAYRSSRLRCRDNDDLEIDYPESSKKRAGSMSPLGRKRRRKGDSDEEESSRERSSGREGKRISQSGAGGEDKKGSRMESSSARYRRRPLDDDAEEASPVSVSAQRRASPQRSSTAHQRTLGDDDEDEADEDEEEEEPSKLRSEGYDVNGSRRMMVVGVGSGSTSNGPRGGLYTASRSARDSSAALKSVNDGRSNYHQRYGGDSRAGRRQSEEGRRHSSRPAGPGDGSIENPFKGGREDKEVRDTRSYRGDKYTRRSEVHEDRSASELSKRGARRRRSSGTSSPLKSREKRGDSGTVKARRGSDAEGGSPVVSDREEFSGGDEIETKVLGRKGPSSRPDRSLEGQTGEKRRDDKSLSPGRPDIEIREPRSSSPPRRHRSTKGSERGESREGSEAAGGAATTSSRARRSHHSVSPTPDKSAGRERSDKTKLRPPSRSRSRSRENSKGGSKRRSGADSLDDGERRRHRRGRSSDSPGRGYRRRLSPGGRYSPVMRDDRRGKYENYNSNYGGRDGPYRNGHYYGGGGGGPSQYRQNYHHHHPPYANHTNGYGRHHHNNNNNSNSNYYNNDYSNRRQQQHHTRRSSSRYRRGGDGDHSPRSGHRRNQSSRDERNSDGGARRSSATAGEDDGGKRDRNNNGSTAASAATQPPKRSWKFDSPPREDEVTATPVTVQPLSSLLPQSVVPSAFMPSSVVASAASILPSSVSSESLKAARELYMGNLPPGLDVTQLVEFLNAALHALGLAAVGAAPVVKAWIAADGHFAFVEFRTIEEASVGLQLNGLNCLGYSLRIGRPKTYPSELANFLSASPALSNALAGAATVLPSAASVAATASALTGPAGVQPDVAAAVQAAEFAAKALGNQIPLPPPTYSTDRLVLLDLPPPSLLSEQQIRALLASYEPLTAWEYFDIPSLEANGMGGTAICILECASHTMHSELKAAFSGRVLVPDTTPLVVMSTEDAIREGKLSDLFRRSEAVGRNLREELGGSLMRAQVPTRVVMLTNLVTPAEIGPTVEEAAYLEIVDDVRYECLEHGKVVAVELPRPSVEAGADNSAVGYAFVEFTSVEGAGAARKALSGRKFAGRTVEAHYFSERKFNAREFKSPQPNFTYEDSSLRHYDELAAHLKDKADKAEESEDVAEEHEDGSEEKQAAKHESEDGSGDTTEATSLDLNVGAEATSAADTVAPGGGDVGSLAAGLEQISDGTPPEQGDGTITMDGIDGAAVIGTSGMDEAEKGAENDDELPRKEPPDEQLATSDAQASSNPDSTAVSRDLDCEGKRSN